MKDLFLISVKTWNTDYVLLNEPVPAIGPTNDPITRLSGYSSYSTVTLLRERQVSDSEILYKSAAELAESVRDGEVSARELTETSLNRIEQFDGEINAFTTVLAEQALEEADKIEPGDNRPFAGVPIAIKDLNVAMAGVVMSQGSDLVGDFTPGHDNNVVKRVKEAGFIIVGKTSSPEFGILPVTEPRRFGPTRNPWDLERTPGGSSGGSSAAVAAGMVPVAHGSDGGGSIRIPASCCGLVGLKPNRGRISKAPDMGEALSGFATDGVLTRTVDDTAQLLDILEGYEPGDPYWTESPEVPFAQTSKVAPKKLKIGYTTLPPIETEVESCYVEAVSKTAEILDSLGHDVEEATPAWNDPEMARLLEEQFTVMWASGVSQAAVIGGMMAGGKDVEEGDIEPLSWALYQLGIKSRAVDYLNAQLAMNALARTVVPFWSDYDILVTPGLARLPVKIGEIDGCADDPMAEFKKSARFTPFTPLFNATGQPAISLPVDQSNGLPVAVQFVGAPSRDDVLLSLATQMEAANPWADWRPDLEKSLSL